MKQEFKSLSDKIKEFISNEEDFVFVKDIKEAVERLKFNFGLRLSTTIPAKIEINRWERDFIESEFLKELNKEFGDKLT